MEKTVTRIFILHAKANAPLAKALAEALESLGKKTFLSSRAGDLRADEDWLSGIEDALQQSSAYIILLTPESTLRPWVNFEAGAVDLHQNLSQKCPFLASKTDPSAAP